MRPPAADDDIDLLIGRVEVPEADALARLPPIVRQAGAPSVESLARRAHLAMVLEPEAGGRVLKLVEVPQGVVRISDHVIRLSSPAFSSAAHARHGGDHRGEIGA
jgi:hypothetical protein